MTELGAIATGSFLSVVVCTRNRALSLERLLNSIFKMTIPARQHWEMVVVDNGSTDETPAIIKNFENRLPIRGVFEPRPGLSNARNRGIASVLGDYILWTDDDVEVEENWLARYVQVFSWFPNGVVFGGPIIAKLVAPTPAWFKENMDLLCDVMAVRDFGDADLPLSVPDRIPYGANYAIRAAAQRQYPYDPELGASPGKRRVGEETSVISAILGAGNAGYWVAGAKVFHIIPTERQTEKYIKHYFGRHGETSAFGLLSKNQRSRPQIILHHGSRLLLKAMIFYAFKAFLPSTWRIRRIMEIGRHAGALNYAWKHRVRPGI